MDDTKTKLEQIAEETRAKKLCPFRKHQGVQSGEGWSEIIDEFLECYEDGCMLFFRYNSQDSGCRLGNAK